jgi:hypothetical protein
MPKYEEYIDFIMRMPAWDPPVKHSLTSHDECKSEQSKSLGLLALQWWRWRFIVVGNKTHLP